MKIMLDLDPRVHAVFKEVAWQRRMTLKGLLGESLEGLAEMIAKQNKVVVPGGRREDGRVQPVQEKR